MSVPGVHFQVEVWEGWREMSAMDWFIGVLAVFAAYAIGMKSGGTSAMGQALASELVLKGEELRRRDDVPVSQSQMKDRRAPAERIEGILRGVTLPIEVANRLHEVIKRATFPEESYRPEDGRSKL